MLPNKTPDFKINFISKNVSRHYMVYAIISHGLISMVGK